VFALGNLVVGTGAFVIGGIVEPLARSLGTSVAGAGQLMTVYSLANAIAAPVLVAAVGRWDARRVLVGALLLLVLANAAAALAASWGQLAAARVAMACGAAIYTPTAAAMVVALVPPALRGRALSIAFAGVGLSYVVGVPFGAWAGLSRFGWPLAFWAVAAAAGAAALLTAARVPAGVATAPASTAGYAQVLRMPRAMLALAVTGLYFATIFSIFSYIGAWLREYAGVPPAGIAAVLAAFGVAALAGTFAGGALADRLGPTRLLYAICAGFALVFAAMWALPGRTVPLVAALLVWGVIGFAFYAAQQSRLVAVLPQQATVMLTLNATLLYVGTAAGAAIGGLVIETVGWRGLPVVALALITLVAAALRLSEPPRAAAGPVPT
jgi:DHA1 family inner membrane transport protein